MCHRSSPNAQGIVHAIMQIVPFHILREGYYQLQDPSDNAELMQKERKQRKKFQKSVVLVELLRSDSPTTRINPQQRACSTINRSIQVDS
jgi:hypothetical protein